MRLFFTILLLALVSLQTAAPNQYKLKNTGRRMCYKGKTRYPEKIQIVQCEGQCACDVVRIRNRVPYSDLRCDHDLVPCWFPGVHCCDWDLCNTACHEKE